MTFVDDPEIVPDDETYPPVIPARPTAADDTKLDWPDTSVLLHHGITVGAVPTKGTAKLLIPPNEPNEIVAPLVHVTLIDEKPKHTSAPLANLMAR